MSNINPARILTVCIAVSLAAHLSAAVMLERFGRYDLGTAISTPAVVMVTVQQPPSVQQAQPEQKHPVPTESAIPQTQTQVVQPNAETILRPLKPDVPKITTSDSKKQETPEQNQEPEKPLQLQTIKNELSNKQFVDPDHILTVQQERLAYQISLAGIPVGSAQLDASNKDGEIRITSSIRSNSVISAFYPVNTTTDTRLIRGRFLLTRIRQQEGLFVSDTGFNLMYHERKIFWVDRLKKRFSDEVLESLDTLDFVSGFYFLRLQPLKVGTSLTLRLYDGDTTIRVPITVLREETLSLPGVRKSDTLVVEPRFPESGFFRNNRDLLIWLTNDDNRVPVRFEVTTPIGRIVAELVSSERVVQPTSLVNASIVVPADKMQYR